MCLFLVCLFDTFNEPTTWNIVMMSLVYLFVYLFVCQKNDCNSSNHWDKACAMEMHLFHFHNSTGKICAYNIQMYIKVFFLLTLFINRSSSVYACLFCLPLSLRFSLWNSLLFLHHIGSVCALVSIDCRKLKFTLECKQKP